MPLVLQSDSFEDGQEIPRKYGYKNGNSSPSLKISGIPPETKSLALIMDDPDAMGAVGKIWVHWLVWNISPSSANFEEDSIPKGAVEGKTDFGDVGYGGPAPPDKEHTYIFKLYALDMVLDLPADSEKSQVEDSIKNHIIEETKLEGRYAP
ncbi:MAG: YbhB/YbcL family Raf kinase inhibitor-like protein [Thaumarchaeota archaeon]|nr:YbhB/YbcL family Raf kinase inhibitor-like protein [Nitrososphaerota archaeon]